MGIKVVCSKCGSDEVSKDAVARWCDETQEWELTVVYDQAFCDVCDVECSVTEIPVIED